MLLWCSLEYIPRRTSRHDTSISARTACTCRHFRWEPNQASSCYATELAPKWYDEAFVREWREGRKLPTHDTLTRACHMSGRFDVAIRNVAVRPCDGLRGNNSCALCLGVSS